MRTIHYARPTAGPHLEPLCGEWGSTDTHWTEDMDGVTCVACLEALRSLREPRAGAERRPG